MIKAYSIGTSEIDSPEKAVQDILSQLGALTLLSSTAGIMVCHYDYINSGVAEAVGAALPFDTIGYTTFFQATKKNSGLYEMTITILTSDDVTFAAGSSEDSEPAPLPDPNGVIPLTEAAYQSARAACNADPSLIISFLPKPYFTAGDLYLRTIDALSGGAPHFGAVSTGDIDSARAKVKGSEIFTLINGKALICGCVMLLCVGNVRARFFSGSYPERNLLELSGTVTKSQGNIVHSVGNHTALDFLKRGGLVFNDEAKLGLPVVPFLHWRNEAALPIARTMRDYSPDGSITFVGEIPEGSLLRVGAVSMEDLLSVTQQTTRESVSAAEKPALLLAFSCIVRYMALGMDPEAEIQCAIPEIPEDVEYLIGYAFGELCPIPISNGQANCFHNNSFIVCALY